MPREAAADFSGALYQGSRSDRSAAPMTGVEPWSRFRSKGTGAVSFGEAIQTVFRKYAEFTGRATRAEFWWWALFNVLVAGALNLFNVIQIGKNAYLGSLLAGVWGIAVLLPSLAVAVRRLRDAGHSWGNLFFILVPIAGIVVLITLWAQPMKAEVPATTAATE
jgi:uncharacterized membrane protein YhaH (DUF805 family)